MSFFEGQTPGWPQQQHGRQQSWDHSNVSSQLGPLLQRDDISAFDSQFEEIDRASDNLAKGNKGFGAPPSRRDPTPMGSFSRQFQDFDRMSGQQRHVADYDGMRSHSSQSSSSLQGYLANQRFGSRQSEADQMMQAKRRAAAQRERELRNYHQEQQYNRGSTGPKSDRSMSPNAMNEEDRRDLIARQHRALYGDNASLYPGDGSAPRPMSQDARVLASAANGHGSSPLAFDAFGAPGGSSTDAAASTGPAQQQKSPTNSISSKSPNPNTFMNFDNSQQPNRTSTTSPGDSPPRQGATAPGASGVAPIGTRPAQTAVQSKRTSPPTSSPLGYGYEKNNNNANERSTSATSNPTSAGAEKPMGMGWGANSGPWSSNKNTLGVQASVWG